MKHIIYEQTSLVFFGYTIDIKDFISMDIQNDSERDETVK